MLSLLRKLPGARKDTFNEKHEEDLRDIEIKGKSKIMYKTLNVLCLGVAVLFSIGMFTHKDDVLPMAGRESKVVTECGQISDENAKFWCGVDIAMAEKDIACCRASDAPRSCIVEVVDKLVELGESDCERMGDHRDYCIQMVREIR